MVGCGGDAEQTSGPSSPAPDPAEGEVCAWPVRADEVTQNVAYPDTAATYWALSYALADGEELELAGTYPVARYASFITYGPAGGAIDVLTDSDIVPDPGGANPFAGDEGPPGTYTVRLTRDEPQTDAGSAPDVLAARRGAVAPEASGGAPAPTFPEGEGPPEVVGVLGSGVGDDDVVAGTVIYRVYLAAGDDPAGGPLPEVAVVGADGDRTPVPPCAEPAASPRAVELAEANGPPTDREAPPQPIFVRPETGTANLFPNPDNVYIATIASHRPGVVAVVTGRAPTFGLDGQVRYWSLCTNEYRKPYPVSHCVADEDVVLDDEGRFTFVISTPEDRPATATTEAGVTWVDWGSTEHDAVLLLRHMLADPAFAESAVNAEPGALARDSMGAYAPDGRYCTVAAFEADGPQCPPA
ncbi:hypothetical protein HC251_23860 [Iamia sp. SCSIO 61187]|uniref:hypothetical protein n=1 Tax=Iamia sp. SCSIO 61187 TaxID=2722752 RepID=UPI001C638A1B|nr:hypothetical protein [Iamia sp. SCSIO 61187]QYG95161.1 hypothetical protein HC251_23860 [Iamia sp. SCSIO 61187]